MVRSSFLMVRSSFLIHRGVSHRDCGTSSMCDPSGRCGLVRFRGNGLLPAHPAKRSMRTGGCRHRTPRNCERRHGLTRAPLQLPMASALTQATFAALRVLAGTIPPSALLANTASKHHRTRASASLPWLAASSPEPNGYGRRSRRLKSHTQRLRLRRGERMMRMKTTKPG